MTVEHAEEATACAISEDDQPVGCSCGHDAGRNALSGAVKCAAMVSTPAQGNRPARGRVPEVKSSADREGESVAGRGDGRFQSAVGSDRCESHAMGFSPSAGLDDNQLV